MKHNLLVDDRWREGGINRFFHGLVAGLEPQFLVSGLTGKWHLNRPLNPMNPFFLAWEIKRRHPDVFWSPGFMSPICSSIPFIFTVHDLIHARAVRGVRAAFFQNVLRPLCKKAYKLVTVSEFSRHEICEWAGLPLDRVVRIYNAASSHFAPQGAKFFPAAPYLLYVGARSAHKNLCRVLQAFAKSGLEGQCKLLFSGAADSQLQGLASDLSIENSLQFAGVIPDADLPAYYRGALALIMVSVYEGFGLPALEAMACGTPVLCSYTTSFPEVVGDAALMVNPENVDDIAQGMKRIVFDDWLRRDLIAKGLVRRRVFSWHESSRRLSDLLLEAVDSRSS